MQRAVHEGKVQEEEGMYIIKIHTRWEIQHRVSTFLRGSQELTLTVKRNSHAFIQV